MTRLLSCAFALALASLPSLARAAPLLPINAVVGDASWVERYGRAPTAKEALLLDDMRHEVHLAWIEGHLRNRPVSHLRPEQRTLRSYLLDALAEYRARGEHPVGGRPDRSPRFVDGEGRVCAVGYLIEVSAGRALVESINARWEHDYLLEITDPALDAWIEASGFTARELASIQPTYYTGPVGGSLDLGDGDAWLAAIGAGLILAVDVAFLAVDLSRRAPLSRPMSIAQVAFGAIQLVAAAFTFGGASQLSSESDWRDPIYAAAALASAFGALHFISGIVNFTSDTPSASPRVSVALAPTLGGGLVSIAGAL